MIKIPEKLWFVLGESRDNNLAYITHYGEDAAFDKRKETGQRWACQRMRWAQPPTPNVPQPEGHVVPNDPTTGFYIGSSVSRYTTDNKLFKIQDPRGFELEISADNLSALLHNTTVVNGLVTEPCLYGFTNGRHILLPDGCEAHKQALKDAETLSTGLIKVKDLSPGDIVRLFNDDEGEYVYYGHGKFTWLIKEGGVTRSCLITHATRLRGQTVTTPAVERELKGSKHVHVFKITTGYRRECFTVMNNPKIVKIVGKADIISNRGPDVVQLDCYSYNGTEKAVTAIHWRK